MNHKINSAQKNKAVRGRKIRRGKVTFAVKEGDSTLP